MFKLIKMYFKEPEQYKSRKRYMMLQKSARKKMKKMVKEFCPWSGYYMHEMIRCMLEFYAITYEKGDCCWSEDERRLRIAAQLKKAVDNAAMIDKIDDMELSELTELAQKDKIAFSNFVKKTECDLGKSLNEKALGYAAYNYLEKKYTKAMYDTIGKHIWGWCD